MLEELQSKIDLYQEQIDNLNQSGHFTDKEIETQSIPLKAKLSILKSVKALRVLSIESDEAANKMMEFFDAAENKKKPIHVKYGMTPESYEEGSIYHKQCFEPLFIIPNQKTQEA
ncbi:hypothetical protein AAGV28_06930 [Flavobacterium sp. FZUC8N2.13]|uniref:Uncharacterized protein n=1 Tax=Flavobacterium zubiriense TaxID=3138075 RepID=A0ABV4TDR4_9FLAO